MAQFEGTKSIRYRSLSRTANELRLIELHPASSNDVGERVVCRLVHEELSEASEFIGLSSLYGDVKTTEFILLNGTRVAIPAHVAEALRYIRAVFLVNPSSTTDLRRQSKVEEPLPPPRKKPPGWLRSLLKDVRGILAEPSTSSKSNKHGTSQGSSSPPLRIWLDLLCINMRDPREESRRRSHTAYAYRNAKMVVGWLGAKDPTSDLAIDIIRAWDRCMPASFGEPGDREAHPDDYAPTLQWMAPVAHLSHVPEGIRDPREVPSYKAVSRFLNRPYFRNAWILDDMALARFPAFLVGDEIVSWMQILRLNRVNEDIRDHGAEMFPDELRPLLEYMPLGSVYTFLKEFDQRQRLETGSTKLISPTISRD